MRLNFHVSNALPRLQAAHLGVKLAYSAQGARTQTPSWKLHLPHANHASSRKDAAKDADSRRAHPVAKPAQPVSPVPTPPPPVQQSLPLVQNGKVDAGRSSPRNRCSPSRGQPCPFRSSRHSFSVDCGDQLPGAVSGGARGRGVTPLLEGGGSGPSEPRSNHHRLVVLGGPRVGKSAIIHRFLHDRFLHDYSATVEEFHRGDYDIGGGTSISLDILDTGGSFEFPAMRRLAIDSGDAFLLVYSVDDKESFELVRKLRDDVLAARKTPPPIVVVGNKTDLTRQVHSEMVEPIVCIDWEHGFVECSARDNQNVARVFQELLAQANFKSKVAKATQNRRMSLPVNSFSRDQLSPLPRSKGPRKRTSCAVS